MPINSTKKQYISAIDSLDQREIYPKILDAENNVGLTDILNVVGRYKPTKASFYKSYTNTPLWQTAVVDSVTSGSGTSQVVIVLTAGTSANRRVQDIVKFPNGKDGYVTVVSMNAGVATCTIRSVDGTNLTVAGTNALKFYSNAVGEQSKSRDSLFYGLTVYKNIIQIFKETHAESDIAKITKVEVPGSGYWGWKEVAEKWIKVKGEVNASLLGGTVSASEFVTPTGAIPDPVNSGTVQTTRGLDQYTSLYGVNEQVNTLGTCLLADWNDLTDAMLAKKTPYKHMAYGSTKALRPAFDTFKGLGSSDVTKGLLSLDDTKFDLTVDTFRKDGFEFNFMVLPLLNQPDILGGTDIAKSIYFIPEGQVKTLGDDGNTAGSAPIAQIRYLPVPKVGNNRGNDVWAEIHDGAISPVNPNGDEMVARFSIQTYQGLEVLAPTFLSKMKTIA